MTIFYNELILQVNKTQKFIIILSIKVRLILYLSLKNMKYLNYNINCYFFNILS